MEDGTFVIGKSVVDIDLGSRNIDWQSRAAETGRRPDGDRTATEGFAFVRLLENGAATVIRMEQFAIMCRKRRVECHFLVSFYVRRLLGFLIYFRSPLGGAGVSSLSNDHR